MLYEPKQETWKTSIRFFGPDFYLWDYDVSKEYVPMKEPLKGPFS